MKKNPYQSTEQPKSSTSFEVGCPFSRGLVWFNVLEPRALVKLTVTECSVEDAQGKGSMWHLSMIVSSGPPRSEETKVNINMTHLRTG